jgi:hypothetical protein
MAAPHGLRQPERELTVSTAREAGNEVLNMLGDGNAFDIVAGLNFEGDILCDVLRPMLKRIEGDNTDRVVKLSAMIVSTSVRLISPRPGKLSITRLTV